MLFNYLKGVVNGHSFCESVVDPVFPHGDGTPTPSQPPNISI